MNELLHDFIDTYSLNEFNHQVHWYFTFSENDEIYLLSFRFEESSRI